MASEQLMELMGNPEHTAQGLISPSLRALQAGVLASCPSCL